jgi:hypothetical protein
MLPDHLMIIQCSRFDIIRTGRECFVNLRNGGCFARSSWFAPRTKRYDRGAISDLLATMNFDVEPYPAEPNTP